MKSSNGKSVVLYYTSWATYGRNHQVVDVAKLIDAGATDISYAFFNLVQEGAGWVIKSGDSWADFEKTHTEGILPADNWEDSSNKQAGNLGQFRKLRASGKDFKLHLSVGGWTWSKNFSSAVKTVESRNILIKSIVDFFTTYPVFDGIDFDWEYLSSDGKNYGNDGNEASSTDPDNFISFMTSLRQQLESKGMHKTLSMCVVAAPEKAVFPIEKVHPVIDELRVMTYDFHCGSWGETKSAHQTNPRKSSHGVYSLEEAADFYIGRGVPASKILVGVAFYSRGFGNTDGIGKPSSGGSPDFEFAEEMGVVPYRMLPRPGATEMFDEEAKAGYSYDPSRKVLNTYDTVESVKEKAKLVLEKGLKGLIVWDSSGDAPVTSPRNLTRVMGQYLLQGSSSTLPPVSVPPPLVTAPANAPAVPITPQVPTPAPVPTPQTPVVTTQPPASTSTSNSNPTSGNISAWTPYNKYEAGTLVTFEGKVYQAIMTHSALDPSWTPNIASLWKETTTPVPTATPAQPQTTQPQTTQPQTTPAPPVTQPPPVYPQIVQPPPVYTPLPNTNTSTNTTTTPQQNSSQQDQKDCCKLLDEIYDKIRQFKGV